MGMEFLRKLPIPKDIKERYPVSEKAKKIKDERDREIRDILSGKSEKLLLIIGPCSADREDSVLDYISRLKKLQDEVKDTLLLVPRIYTNKPRTTGEGYMGLLHQPDPLEKPDLLKGIIAIRKIHLRTLEETGFSCADELLYPENYRYLSDVLSYVAVGARSVEDQQHRLVAAGLDIPVGMKNPTGGDLSVMLNSVQAAQGSYKFLYRGWEVVSDGNDLSHAILRGYKGADGKNVPNYGYETLSKLCELYGERELKNPAVIIDANHSNSGKDPYRQAEIIADVMKSREKSSEIRRLVKGFMVESYLVDGCQPVNGGVYGQSITDPCLGWEKTQELVRGFKFGIRNSERGSLRSQ